MAANQDPDEGRTVLDIRVEPPDLAATVLQRLRTKAEEPLHLAVVRDDLSALWKELKLWADFYVESEPDGVRLIIQVQAYRSFDRFEFKGLEFFTETEIRTVLGLTSRQRINRLAAEQYATTLRERYRLRGFAFVDVRITEDEEHSVLTFWVDEGPRVRVTSLDFVGNHSYPGWAPIRFYDNLVDSAKLELSPDSLRVVSGDPYSAEGVDEDLDRLRLFYRKHGFLDARVELAGIEFSRDREEVALTYRIDEGRRYRIAGIDLLQQPPPGEAEPTYPKSDVLTDVRSRVDDFYDFEQLKLDERRIAAFYGKRGHPLDGQYGRGIRNAFRILDMVERYDIEHALVWVTFVVEEGTPKSLRSVRIKGNSDTQDRVIRRELLAMPGETLDMDRIERSLGRLDALRYFQDPNDFGGVRFELLPIEGAQDQVDLGVDVVEGDTGAFRWGAGVSTAAGVQAQFVLSKRNFDLARPPTSWNPLEWFAQIRDSEALHGAGQELELLLAPGSEISLFSMSFYEPDVFREHQDTIGLRLQGYRRLARLDSFDLDSLGANVGLQRNFDERLAVGVTMRQETVEVQNPRTNAPDIVYRAEGTSELRGVRLNVNLDDVDLPISPTTGYRARFYGELLGGVFGADEDLWKAGVSHTLFVPIHRDSLERAHVLTWRSSFDYGAGYGRSGDLFLTERFYMGGSTLRGFDQRQAGPSQFGEPVGGEARLLGSLEYGFPIFSTKRAGQIRQTEVLRGVLFTDFGMLGLGLDDMGSPRLSAGFGIRIRVPVLELPISLDFGWPIFSENTDDQRQFLFSLSRF
ncbi:MAG: BamA/TamA family outer membrane protein [Planctomycetes bacterium]|nr:BamA/TamA family outer membrane protein [Planctomycetota bacterium]